MTARLAIIGNQLHVRAAGGREPDWTAGAPLAGLRLSRPALAEVLRLHTGWHSGGRRANLSWANLRGATLSESDLSWANLSESDLSESDLSWANLRGANLRGANLRGADLSESDLSESDLSWADLSGAGLPDGCDAGYDGGYYWSVVPGETPGNPWLTYGCERHPLSWWRHQDSALSVRHDHIESHWQEGPMVAIAAAERVAAQEVRA